VNRAVSSPRPAGDPVAALVAEKILQDTSPRTKLPPPNAAGGWRDLEGEARRNLPRLGTRDVARAVKLLEESAANLEPSERIRPPER
jgi:hypothetical protein